MNPPDQPTRTTLLLLLQVILAGGCCSSNPARYTYPPYTASPREAICPAIPAGTLVIDGRLNEPAWTNSLLLTDFVTTGKNPTSAQFQTECRFLWTGTELIAGFRCLTPSAKAVGTRRDNPIFEGDAAELMLCPRGADRPYFEIDVNPSNIVYDTHILSWHWEDLSVHWQEWALTFNPRIRSATAPLMDRGQVLGWTAELTIPFEDLPGSRVPSHGTVWRFNAARAATRADGSVEYSSWTPTYGDFHRPFTYPALRFSTPTESSPPPEFACPGR